MPTKSLLEGQWWLPNNPASFWTMLTAIFAGGAAFAALWTLWAQVRQSRVEMWHAMVDKFDFQLRGARHDAAESWWKERGFKNIIECQRIMDFFEDIAYMMKKNLIDKNLAYNTFSHYFIYYFLATEEVMKEEQKDDPEYFEDVFHLKSKWAQGYKIGRREGDSLIDGNVDFLEIRRFFEEERKMCAPRSQ